MYVLKSSKLPKGGDVASKLAVTDLAVVMEIVHEPVPEQAPDQPVKVEPAEAVAVKVTEVPDT